MKIKVARTPVAFKKLLQMDALGAITTAFMLSQVLARWVNFFGMPRPILLVLSAIASTFFIFALSTAFGVEKVWIYGSRSCHHSFMPYYLNIISWRKPVTQPFYSLYQTSYL